MKTKNNYFKHKSRSFLTEEQKRQTFEAVNRGRQYLVHMYKQNEVKKLRIKDGYQFIYPAHKRMTYLRRLVKIVKGYTQPRYQLQHQRETEITYHAFLIAKDTGANFEEVRERFFAFMLVYVEQDDD